MCASPKMSPLSAILPFTSDSVRSLQRPSAVISPLHLVRGEVALVRGEVHLHRARDGVQVDVAVGGGDVRAAAQAGGGHVAAPGVHRDMAALGTVMVRLRRPLLWPSDLTSTALPLTVTCAASDSKILRASASESA